MNSQRLARHVAQIAAREKITIQYYKSRVDVGGRAFPYLKLMKIQPIKSDVTYAFAMHELGHMFDDESDWLDDTAWADAETAAWIWAKRHALIWTRRMTHTMRHALWTRVRQIGHLSHMIRPRRGHPIFDLIRADTTTSMALNRLLAKYPERIVAIEQPPARCRLANQALLWLDFAREWSSFNSRQHRHGVREVVRSRPAM